MLGMRTLCLGLLLLLVGCASSPEVKPDPIQEYLSLLREPAAPVPGGEAAARRAVEGFADFYENLSEENVAGKVDRTYSEDVFFYDTLKLVRSRPELSQYMLETARNTESVKATILDVASSGGDYYVRWVMEIRLKKFKKGQTLTSVGVTHLRFDPEGKISLHYDYWDSTAGFFEHVPLVGGVLRWIKSKF